MISYKEAQHIISLEAKSFGTEIIRLNDADDRILAENIFADRDYPPFNRSAMDGYAICFQDWENGWREFEVQETIYAGKTPQKDLKTGAAFKIMTGAAVPLSANCVIRKEEATESNSKVSFQANSLLKFQCIAQKGEDLKKDALAIPAHSICSTTVISTLATLGKSKIKVETLPKVALFTTGNEVRTINDTLSDVEIRNSNFYMLKSMLQAWKIKPSLYKHLSDNKSELTANISKAFKCDIIILSGGVSTGDADHVPEILENLDVKKLFHKVAIKPGKPIWCGKIPEGPMVFALPGNPFSSLVTFKLFIEAFLKKSLGLNDLLSSQSFFKGTKKKKTALDEFFPARFTNSDTQLEETELNGSGDIRLGNNADVLALHPKSSEVLNDLDIVEYYRL